MKRLMLLCGNLCSHWWLAGRKSSSLLSSGPLHSKELISPSEKHKEHEVKNDVTAGTQTKCSFYTDFILIDITGEEQK